MKRLFLCTITLLVLQHARAEQKSIRVPFVEDLPDGVAAWEQSGLLADKRETRFEPYDKNAAEKLVLDATTDRGVAGEEGAAERETAFRVAYNERGVDIFIEAAEPLMRSLLDASIDPRSPGRKEALEVFFSPSLEGSPYYQLFINLFSGKTDYYDWDSPSENYRSLKEFAQVEVKPLKRGFGVSLFIPWEAIYESLPVDGGEWRFTIVRWMPFGKAGGVTWGGKVHETGQFGILKFEKPTAGQRARLETRLARYAWFHFLVQAQEASRFWSDDKIGDPVFYAQELKPLIERLTTFGQSLGEPDAWTSESLEKIRSVQKDWMEFHYKVEEARNAWLVKKRFEESR